MINSIQFTVQKMTLLFTLMLSVVLLQGCGGAREFNDSGSSSSSVSSTVKVEVITSDNGIDPLIFLGDNDDLSIISNQEEFDKEWPKYKSGEYDKTKFNFKEGQAVIYYGGTTSDCPELKFSSYSTHTYTENGKTFVSFIINRTLDGIKVSSSSSTDSSNSSTSLSSSSISSSSSSVSCTPQNTYHTFKIFYVYTRALILPGVNP